MALSTIFKSNYTGQQIDEKITQVDTLNAELEQHVNNKENPHNVTLAQIGAEPMFEKKTAFNKDFGTEAGTVCEGNDSRLSNARPANGGNADTVGGKSPSDFATAEQGTKADNAILFTEQTLTDEQKSQARANIGAGASGFSGAYSDLSGKPQINTENTESQVPSANEEVNGVLKFHKISKTGNFNDLNNKPTIPEKISQLQNDTGFITKIVEDLVNYYTKTEMDSKISQIPKFSIAPVDELPTVDISTTTVYLVKDNDESGNLYTEYIYVNDTWEKLGSQKLNLDGYATEEWVNTQIANFVTAEQLNVLTQKVDTHIANKSNPHEVTAAQVGLGNVNNTADLDKPISTATQEALDTKAEKTDLEALVARVSSLETLLTAEGYELIFVKKTE